MKFYKYKNKPNLYLKAIFQNKYKDFILLDFVFSSNIIYYYKKL